MKQEMTNDFYDLLTLNKSMESNSLELFGQFIGSWEWSGFDYDEKGTKTETSGKWIFETVLNGTAIQDIFTFQNPNFAKDGKKYLEYGTTIRFPMEDGRIWKSIWIGPMNKVIRIFETRRINDEIVLNSKIENGELIQWIFSKITGETFQWRGEKSFDEGKTWFLYEDLNAKRI